MGAEHPGAVPRGDRARGQRPHQPLVEGAVEGLADEVLVGQRDQHRPAGGDHLVEPSRELERVPGVLVEVVGRVDQHAVAAHAERDCPLGERHRRLGRGGHHVVVRRAVRRSAGGRAVGVRAHQGGAVLGGDLGQGGVEAAPGVVEQVGAGGAHLPGDLRAPGVDADDHVGELRADLRDERHGAPQLLLDVDGLAGAGLDATDVDDVGALGHRDADPLEGPVLGEGRAAVVEGVAGAVDDGHHQQVAVREGAMTESEHRSNLPAGAARPQTAGGDGKTFGHT